MTGTKKESRGTTPAATHRSRLAVGTYLSLLCAALAACAGQAPPEDGPTLIVVVVVDQLRADLLDRYDELFTGGFRRLAVEGHRFTDASHRHAVTETAPGHATISTGVHPARHGLVANTWTESSGGEERAVQAVSDPLAPILGSPGAPGRSPRNLLRGGLADWVHAHDPGARIVAVSRKDAAAIPLGGSVGGYVFWLDPAAGRFVTSAFYREAGPDWLTAFNRDAVPALLGDSIWKSTIPAGAETLARRADFPHAGDGVNLSFPHRFDREGGGAAPHDFNLWVADTPMPDRATAELAKLAVAELGLGAGPRPGPDYLAISFSQTDIIGHRWGPLSQQQLDNLLRLDRILGDLLDFLDAEVGPGSWTLGFTADHGVLDVPEYLQERGLPGRRITRTELASVRETARAARAGARSDEERIQRVSDAVRHLDFIADVLTPPTAAAPADTIAELFANSYHPERPAGTLSGYHLQLLQTEGTLMSYRSGRGSGHASAYLYDRHVPLIFLGAGVPAGASAQAVATVDLAPTLARLGQIPTPSDLDGRPIHP